MPRRAEIAPRTLLRDPVYDSTLVTQVINRVMLHGKKSNAEQIVHEVEWVVSDPPTGGPTGMSGSTLLREPIGVVAAITPFNFPYYLNAIKTASALAAGCTVVLKPHSWTPLDAFLIAQAAEEVDFPRGTDTDLARPCIRRFGDEVLEGCVVIGRVFEAVRADADGREQPRAADRLSGARGA